MDLNTIRHGMAVVGADGQPLGTVDYAEASRIKLRRNDPGAGGQHHWVPQGMIDRVEGDTVRLTMPAAQARSAWLGEAAVQSPLGEGPVGLGDEQTGTGGQSMVHAPETLETTARGEPGPRPDKPLPDAPSRDKDRDMRR
ncbi:DUF2171 domain-containing protein [Paracraurococcus lichenis]|uniref:DUF2171 domain-containing protein n=1 Tax=Paracraurococcus lichenis TaxID=3064888 RepID=A0ABT9E4C7_9PROT|nr:DUF2171 domain-containing protein [Paracraurococcus sp. LOR1-02]MDO9711021.1 DUF2171 domain-containing protein [Paracraurococcus sp. LOR1-02]